MKDYYLRFLTRSAAIKQMNAALCDEVRWTEGDESGLRPTKAGEWDIVWGVPSAAPGYHVNVRIVNDKHRSSMDALDALFGAAPLTPNQRFADQSRGERNTEVQEP